LTVSGESAVADHSELRRQRAHYTCPACGDEHVVPVDVHLEPEPIVFGGPGDTTPHSRKVTLECPRDHVLADVLLPLTAPAGYLVASCAVVGKPEPAVGNDVDSRRVGKDVAGPARDVYDEARKQSVEAIRRFAASLLTTSTGGVAVYFTVLKYLGLESAQPESFLGKAITVLPAALLVGAAAVSLWACQPLLAAVPMEDFDASRARYLRSRMRRANVAAALLLAATLVSVGVWTMLVFR